MRKHNRRDFLKKAFTTGLAACAGGALTQPAFGRIRWGRQDRPNFLFIMLEDIGAHMSCLGTPQVQTPNMDALAADGVVFSTCHTGAQSCSPSKASVFTSQYPHDHNTRDNTQSYFGTNPPETTLNKDKQMWLPDHIPTLIELLNEGGYQTAITRKFHLTTNHRYPFHTWIHDNTLANLTNYMQNTTEPWLLHVNYQATHRPFGINAPNSPVGSDPDKSLMDIPAFLPLRDKYSGISTAIDDSLNVFENDWQQYLKAVQGSDNVEISQAMDALQQSGQADNTIVIVFGDHGPAYHGRGKKSPYLLGKNVPLIIAGPDRYVKNHAQPCDELVDLMDIMPTILDYAGIYGPRNMKGKTLRPILEQRPDAAGHDFLIGEIHHGAPTAYIALQERSIFDGRYMLIFRDHMNRSYEVPADCSSSASPHYNYTHDEVLAHQSVYQDEYIILAQRNNSITSIKAPEFEFYDTLSDPHQVTDLYDDPVQYANYESDIIRLKNLLRQWAVSTGDTYINPDKIV